VEDDFAPIRGNHLIAERPQRLAQVEDTGAQIIECGFVAVLAPEQGRQLAAQFAAVGVDCEIGEKHPFALSRHCNPASIGKSRQLELGEQTQRPTGPNFASRLGSRRHFYSLLWAAPRTGGTSSPEFQL